MSLQFINGDLDVKGGYLGENVTITGVTTNFSLIPGTGAIPLDKYYNNYTIQTESSIVITLPSAGQVTVGWYCRIDMISNTGTGQITIFNGISNIAVLNPNSTFGNVRTSVNLILIDNLSNWSVLYSVPNSASAYQIPVATSSGILLRNYLLAKFFSFCDVVSGTPIDVNTITDVALRWINPNGQFMDPLYYSVVANTQITMAVTGSYYFGGVIGINNQGGAIQNNLRIRPRLNGVTFLTSFVVVSSTIQNFANGVYSFDGAFSLNAGDYIEIMVGKSLISIGTNLVDLANTSMTVVLAGQN